MHHIENKNSLLRAGARYFVGILAAILIAGAIFTIAYQAGRPAPRTQVHPAVDPAIEEPFFELFSAVHQPETRTLFPPFDYIDPQGRRQRFSVGRGEIVLLNIWATWCPPCLIELPDLGKLQALLPENTPVRIMAVSADTSYDQAGLAEFIRERGLWAEAASHDIEGVIMRNAPLRGLPSSFLLAEGGEILYIFEGAAPWADPASQAYFKGLMPSR